MKINNTTLLVGLAGIGAIAYFYFKNKKGSTETMQEAYDDGLGGGIGGGSFGLPMGIPIANPAVIINNRPTKPKKPSKKEVVSQVESMPQAVASAPSLSSSSLGSSTPTSSTSSGTISTTSTRVAPPTRIVDTMGNTTSVIDGKTALNQMNVNARRGAMGGQALSSSFIDFDGNEDIQRSALDFDTDID